MVFSNGDRPALSNDDGIAEVELEGRGDVGRHVLVALLVTVVLLDVVKVIAADDDSPAIQKEAHKQASPFENPCVQ